MVRIICVVLDLLAVFMFWFSVFLFRSDISNGYLVVYSFTIGVYILWCRRAVLHYVHRKELEENGFE